MNKKVVLIVMDGVGTRAEPFGNAVLSAYTPTLDALKTSCPYTNIKAHGTAVGLPSDDDMGNSEVGHNALGCGQIYAQGAKLVNESIESGKMYASETWKKLTDNCKNGKNGTLHFLGLLSDGNVHSNINHLFSMIRQAKIDGVSRVRIHILLDGRDVPATSAPIYIEQLENVIKEVSDSNFDVKIASGGGRMKITMDRYEANWEMVENGWKTHILGEGRQFSSAISAVEELRKETNALDQDLPPFVISENGKPCGAVKDGDSFILFNFRGDRAIEISKAFDKDFDKFDRILPDVMFAGMLEYDGDLKIPKNYLVSPPDIQNTLSELFVKNNVKQYAVSETQKFGHVTYFWNGNRSEKFSETLEIFEEVPSDIVPFEQRPWMKAAEVTDKLIAAMNSGEYGFLRCNFPNGDMVGHTGNFAAAQIAVETVDLCLARILAASGDYTVVITADHGNADEMYEKSKTGEKKPKTAHTLNPVPFIIVDKNTNYTIKEGDFGLANVAATIAKIMGIKTPEASPYVWEEAIIQ